MGADGVEEALMHTEHIKPYVDDAKEDKAEPQPPEGEEATSDSPQNPDETQPSRDEGATRPPRARRVVPRSRDENTSKEKVKMQKQ